MVATLAFVHRMGADETYFFFLLPAFLAFTVIFLALATGFLVAIFFDFISIPFRFGLLVFPLVATGIFWGVPATARRNRDSKLSRKLMSFSEILATISALPICKR